MRKQNSKRRFSRTRKQDKALLKGLARALFLYEKIETTEAKAKEVSKFADKCITKAKQGTFNARRHLSSLFDDKVVKKLVDDIGKRYKERSGGYTRIFKLGPRQSDSAEMAIIELMK